MKEANKKVAANMFIIPNEITTIPVNHYDFDVQSRKLEMYFGFKLTSGTKLVQIWTTNDECDSWGDSPSWYRDNFDEEMRDLRTSEEIENEVGKRFYNYFPSRIPLDLLKDKVEGDKLEITSEVLGVDFEFTMSQETGRYRRFGKFEQVLKSLL